MRLDVSVVGAACPFMFQDGKATSEGAHPSALTSEFAQTQNRATINDTRQDIKSFNHQSKHSKRGEEKQLVEDFEGSADPKHLNTTPCKKLAS